MKLIIRCDKVLIDLEQYTQLTHEVIAGRDILVGIRHTGRRIAILVLREERGLRVRPPKMSDVFSAISCVLDSGRRVCALTEELEPIGDDVRDDIRKINESSGRPIIEALHPADRGPIDIVEATGANS